MNASFVEPVSKLYGCVSSRLDAHELDQEVKERAIVCLGQLVATVGDALQDQTAGALAQVLAKLQNEVTRVTATKALADIASSPLKINLSPILADSLTVRT